MSYLAEHPELYPTSVGWALIKAEREWRERRQIALDHAEAFRVAEILAPMWRGAEKPQWYFAFPLSLSLGGLLFKITLRGKESMTDTAPLIDYLLDAGWKVDDGEDYAEIKRRNFKCAKRKAILNLMIFAESEMCRVVEDGTEPKYRLVCGDAA